MGKVWIGWAGAALALPLVAAPAVVALYRPAPPVDDADLAVVRRSLADGENGLRELRSASDAVWWPAGREADLQALARGDRDDPALLGEVLAHNRAPLARARRALAAPGFQTPPSELDAPPVVGIEALGVARLLALAGLARARSGDAGAALASIGDAVELGARVRDAEGGGLLEALVGIGMMDAALESVPAVVGAVAPSPERARQEGTRWLAARSQPDTWSHVWRSEYAAMHQAIDRAWQAGPDAFLGFQVKSRWASGYLFDPHATHALFADYFRALQAGTGGPCEELAIPRITPPQSWLGRARLYAAPNAVGRILFYTAVIDPRRYEERRCRTDTHLGAATVVLAARAYQGAHGALPGALDELVPQYLAAIPRDGFRGKPLHYDPHGTHTVGTAAETPDGTRWRIPF